ncbi:ead/Ea22-like family protein [Escherichia coli]
MSNIDKRGLREVAEKATKGRWAVEFDDEIYSTDGVNHEQIAMVFSENEARDAVFIAAANPATVLALLDELESKDRRNAELEAKLANPVLLPKTNGYWTEQEKAYEDAITLAKRQIRLAGFSVEDM